MNKRLLLENLLSFNHIIDELYKNRAVSSELIEILEEVYNSTVNIAVGVSDDSKSLEAKKH